MIARLLILLLVYKTTRCDEVPATKKTLFVPVISEKCKYIKCSTQEDPKCVKLKNEKTGNSVYIIVLNKCEMRYMECVNGFDAKFVSMKYCGHQNLTMKLPSNSTGNSGKRRRRPKRRNRVKREARKQRLVYKSGKQDPMKDDYHSYEDESGYKVQLEEDVSYYSDDPASNWHMAKEYESGYKVQLGEDVDYYSDDPDWHVAQKLSGPRPIAALQNETGDGPVVLVGKLPTRDEGEQSSAPEDKLKKRHRFVPDPRINEDSFPLFSKETLDEHAMNKSADPVDGNTEQCPVTCQTRVQMVCGMCQHGIYKTFMSSCHMRMFSCRFGAETMELVSRYPCILSAPYIAEAGVPASSKVAVNIERDQVLSFIKCRSLGLLKTGVIFLLLICISSIISKTIHKKALQFCIESEPLTQYGEKQVADGSDDKEDIQPSGYEAISTTLEPVVDIAEKENDSQNTSLLHQVDDIDDVTIGSNDTDINEQSNESDVNKGSSESDIITDINVEGNVTDINNENNDTGINNESNVTDMKNESDVTDINNESIVTDINNESNVTDMKNESDVTDINNESIVTDINNESNDNSTTQVNPTVKGIGIDPETEKSHVHDDSNANTENINNTSTETVNNGVNITEKSADETNKGLNDEVRDNTDITNMRKVRAHLLDHLLVYFMNIIKQDKEYTQTRKKYSKDNMKLEDKLRNYYNSVHLDEFLNNNSEEIDMEKYSNNRRGAEGTNEDIIVENKEDPATTFNINIEPLKLVNITTNENPVNESCVTNESISNDNLNNKTEMADLNLQNENEQDDKTSNGKLLLKIEENADTLPNGVAIGDNERDSSTTKIDINDVVTEKGLQNNENNMKSIKEIDGRRKNLNSDENKANNFKENSTQQNTEDKNANNTALHRKSAKKSINVKILDSLKIKGLKKRKGETENLLNQNTVPRPYNLILQFNIHI